MQYKTLFSTSEAVAELLSKKSITDDTKLQMAVLSLPKTERKAAEILADLVGERLHYIEETDTWYVWDGRVHVPSKGRGIPYAVLRDFYRALVDALADVKKTAQNDLRSTADHEGRKVDPKEMKAAYTDLFREARAIRERLAQEAGISAVSRLLAQEVAVSPEHFHDDSRWIVTRNGVYDMDDVRARRVWKLLPHDPSRNVWRFIDVEDDPERTTYNSAFVRWLNTSVEDKAQGDFLLKALSAALLGGHGNTRRIVSIQGKPSSGKSMMLNVFDKLCEGTGYFATPSTDAIVKGGRNPEHARWDMAGARIIAFSEVRQELDQTFLLKFSGGDAFGVDRKYVTGGSRKPQGIVFIANNTSLNVDKSDKAMKDRLAPIHFPHSFEPGHPVYPRDVGLQDAILSDLPGLMAILREAYLRFLTDQDGGEVLPLTAAQIERVRAEEAEEDVLGEFLDDAGYVTPAEVSQRQCVLMKDLMAAYTSYCFQRGIPKKSRKEVQYELESRNVQIVTSNGVRAFPLVAVSA